MSISKAQLDLLIVTAKAQDSLLLTPDDFVTHGLTVIQVESLSAAKLAIDTHGPKVVLSAESDGHHFGIELSQYLREQASLSGSKSLILQADNSAEYKRAALLSGADDCLAAPQDPVEVLSKVRNAVAQYDQNTHWRRAAMTDGLTGLWNQTQFRERLDAEYARTRRYGGELALLMIDLDYFKKINDTYGHETGNAVLARTAGVLQRIVRESDIVARYGGEEFAVICPHTSLHDACRLGERIRRALPAGVQLDQGNERVHASLGVATMMNLEVDSPAALIALADRALYSAKAGGRNRVVSCVDLSPASEQPIKHQTSRSAEVINATHPPAKDSGWQSVLALEQTMASRDPSTARHAGNMAFYASQLMEAENWPEAERLATLNAARWHDLGTIGIPDHILKKPDTLTASEYAVVRRVPDLTCRLLSPLGAFSSEIAIIRHLRERFDGSGYPDGLAGSSIPRASRLLLIVEAFDSLTTPQTHRRAGSFDAALQSLALCAGTDFDPDLLSTFSALTRKNGQAWLKHRNHLAHPPLSASV